ncbi:MAG: hypothetical protein GXP14_08700 [Gammaproteobacteria bacterium]|nr:hypothetical protein [Gammaproteobacteria bacterium]
MDYLNFTTHLRRNLLILSITLWIMSLASSTLANEQGKPLFTPYFTELDAKAAKLVQASINLNAGLNLIEQLFFGEEISDPLNQSNYDHFAALAETKAAILSNRLNKKETGILYLLLLSELYLNNGMLDEAFRNLQLIPRKKKIAHTLDQLFFETAKRYFRKTQYSQAIKAFEAVGNSLNNEEEKERKATLGLAYVNMNKLDTAAQLFEKLKDRSDWGTYGRYNLGISLIHQGKIEKGVIELNKVGRHNFISEEMKALKDRANVALGYLFIRQQEPETAKLYLQRVRLESLYANQALLGIAWANTLSNNYNQALASLFELHERSAASPAVLEAFLAVPHTLTRMTADKQALRFYELAIKFYTKLITKIEQTQRSLTNQQFIEKLIASEESGYLHLIKQTDQNSDPALQSRILDVISQHRFQATLANIKNMMSIQPRFDNWIERSQNFNSSIALYDPNSSLLRAIIPGENNTTEFVNMQDIADRSKVLSTDINQAIEENKAYLASLLDNKLNQESRRLKRYLNQSQFALAQAYDKIITQGTAR